MNAGGREFFSATSNVPFRSEEELHEHYRSGFHRYNLKRRVAGLGPVTKEWFDTHRDKLVLGRSAEASQANNNVIYYDPLSKKSFSTQAKYLEFTNSNKYKKLAKANGGVRPDPVLRTKDRQQQPRASDAKPGLALIGSGKNEVEEASASAMADSESESDSWETASEDEFEGEPWDFCVSLFDNHRSKTIEDNIEYMYKNFGFSVPDVEHLADPEGLIEYLGAKVSRGHIPLYTSGLDPDTKSFGSMHAVQRHMVDTGKTRMVFEENEEEYEDFYDYSDMITEEMEKKLQLAETSGAAQSQVAVSNGYELFLPTEGAGVAKTQKVLGSRNLAQYYKQNHRPLDQRQSVLANKIVQRYRILGLLKQQEEGKQLAMMNKSENKRRENYEQVALHSGIQNAVIKALPRNVPY